MIPSSLSLVHIPPIPTAAFQASLIASTIPVLPLARVVSLSVKLIAERRLASSKIISSAEVKTRSLPAPPDERVKPPLVTEMRELPPKARLPAPEVVTAKEPAGIILRLPVAVISPPLTARSPAVVIFPFAWLTVKLDTPGVPTVRLAPVTARPLLALTRPVEVRVPPRFSPPAERVRREVLPL